MPVPLLKGDEMVELLALWIIAIGFAIMVAGPKAAKKLISVPLKFMADLLIDLTRSILSFAFDLLGRGLRALGRLIERGARRLFGLSQPQSPRRP